MSFNYKSEKAKVTLNYWKNWQYEKALANARFPVKHDLYFQSSSYFADKSLGGWNNSKNMRKEGNIGDIARCALSIPSASKKTLQN